MERRAFIATGAAVAATGLAGCMGDGEDAPGNESDGDGSDPVGSDPPVTIADTDLTIRSRGEASADATPSYWHRGGALHVRGVVTGSDACKTARLADAAWDRDREAVRVQIDTVDAEDAGDMCAQVVTPIAYEATIQYEGPESDLVLEHDGEEVAADRMAPGGGDGGDQGAAQNRLDAVDFTVTGTECGERRQDAEVSRDSDEPSITVDGVLWGPDGCARAELNYASYDRDEAVLVADVASTTTGGELCTECITEVSYRLDASFTALPAGGVAVSHDGVRLDGVGDGVDDAAFEIVEVAPGPADGDVDASFDDATRTVVVRGVMAGSDGCASARLRSVRRERDRLVVDVESVDTRGPGEACTDAVVAVEYRAEVTVDGDLPSEVTITQDGGAPVTVSREPEDPRGNETTGNTSS